MVVYSNCTHLQGGLGVRARMKGMPKADSSDGKNGPFVVGSRNHRGPLTRVLHLVVLLQPCTATL